jgi:hypothetical protein
MGAIRKFGTGATRDAEGTKVDYEGFLSPRVLERFGKYMGKHQFQSDGTKRDSDNWQRGIPVEVYRKSLVRHLFQAWGVWRGKEVKDDRGEVVDLEEALCGVMFNCMGMLHEILKTRTEAD